MCSCNRSSHSSSKMVTGPSLTNSTCMWAPKIPVSTPAPRSRKACTKTATSGSAAAPGAAAFQDGRRPLAVSAYSVNWLTTMIGASTGGRPVVVENSQLPELFGEPPGFVGIVTVRHPDECQQALSGGPDRADGLAVHRHRCRRDSLHQNPHGPMLP